MRSYTGESATHRAAVAALPLAAVTIIFDLSGYLLKDIASLTVILSILKLPVIAAVLYFLMKRFTAQEEYVPYRQSFRYGFKVCLFSSIICTLWYLIYIYVLVPDLIDQLMEVMSATMDQLHTEFDSDQVIKIMPAAMTVSSFIKCIIWGLILPAILANWTKNDSPFSGQDGEAMKESI